MRYVLVALLALPAFPQDDAKIRSLIERLEDDNYEAREKAQKDLVQMGEAALPALKKAVADAAGSTNRGELKARAENAIREIELDVMARLVYREPRTLSLDMKEARLGDVLEEIARQSGLRIDGSAVDAEARVTLSVKEAPLFQVLDGLCRGRSDRSYEYADEGQVRFRKEGTAPAPAFYGGPFRVRITALRQDRSTDFAGKKCSVRVTVDADYEKYLKPLKRYAISLEKASDDQGTALEMKSRAEDEINQVFGGNVRIAVRAGGFGMQANPGGAAAPLEFSLHGLSPAAKSVTLQGTLRYTFPLETREVSFGNITQGEACDCGDYRVRLEQVMNRGRNLTVQFARTKTAPGGGAVPLEIEQRLDRESLVGFDEDGEEHRGQWIPTGDQFGGNFVIMGGAFQRDSGGSEAATYQAMFTTLRTKTLKKIRFRFIHQTLVKSLPFTFRDVELP